MSERSQNWSECLFFFRENIFHCEVTQIVRTHPTNPEAQQRQVEAPSKIAALRTFMGLNAPLKENAGKKQHDGAFRRPAFTMKGSLIGLGMSAGDNISRFNHHVFHRDFMSNTKMVIIWKVGGKFTCISKLFTKRIYGKWLRSQYKYTLPAKASELVRENYWTKG